MNAERPFFRPGRGALPWFAALGLAAFGGAACHHEEAPPARVETSLGESIFSVMCHRVGAQSLPEDVTGASYRDVCDRRADGTFADTVDREPLQNVTLDARASAEALAATRQRGIARVEALARHRAELVKALDAAFPDVPFQTSGGACRPGEGARLHDELGELLRRMVPLYNDGTLPRSTQTLASWLEAWGRDDGVQTALTRFDARQGYRPAQEALAAARALLSYPRLRELSQSLLALLGPDSKPYDLYAEIDSHDRGIPTPGPAYGKLTKLLEVTRAELRTYEGDPVPPRLRLVGDMAGVPRLSRPRTGPELAAEALFAPARVPELATLGPRYIVRRDARGYAALALASNGVPAPFVDADGDGLPDVDLLGRFVLASAPGGSGPSSAPAPFLVPGLAGAPRESLPRDAAGRALVASGEPLYRYGETTQTLGAALLRDTRGLLGADPNAATDPVLDLLTALPAFAGERDGAPDQTKRYGKDGDEEAVAYDGLKPETSPLLDLTHALGRVLGERSIVDTLALARKLATDHRRELARVTGAMLAAKDIADRHPEATLSSKSTFWDEMLDVAAAMAREPGLLEDMLTALAEDDTAALAPNFAKHLTYRDRISYDRAQLNGPPVNVTVPGAMDFQAPVDRTQPDTGDNRSVFQRILQLLNETDGVAVCNKKGAVVHGWVYLGEDRTPGAEIEADLPVTGVGSYNECEFMKIDNLGRFYLDSIVGKAELKFREPAVALGTDVRLLEKASGLQGFWDGQTSNVFRPQPRFLSRQAFFDVLGDSPVKEPVASNPNYVTNRFLKDFTGPHLGTAVCEEYSIPDPVPGAPDRNPDGKVRGLRRCDEGDWLDQRHAGTLFAFEQGGYLKAIAPLVSAVAKHGREDLFIDLMKTLHRHWQSKRGTLRECDPAAPRTSARYCSQDGLVRYEPLLAEVFASDLLPALRDLMKAVRDTTVERCATVDAAGTCTAKETRTGAEVVAEATRALVDPARAKAAGLTDRKGRTTARRNDGTVVPQVTPAYLLTDALRAVDETFRRRTAIDENDERLVAWRRARSALVDQLLAVEGQGESARFRHESLLDAAPTLVDLVRQQLDAHCPNSFVPPYARCEWAEKELVTKVRDLLEGPLLPAALDVLEAIRRDPEARVELRKLLLFLTDPSTPDAPLPAVLAAMHDVPQLLDDDNLTPLLRSLSVALAPPSETPDGTAEGGLVDAQLTLLARLVGRAYHEDGAEDCSWSVDPHGVLPVALRGLVTPATDLGGRTPIEIVLDTIADVNRVEPASTTKLTEADYQSMLKSTVEFLVNRERGLEQFYEVIWRGTRHP